MTKIISLVKSINPQMCWSLLQLIGVPLKPTDEVVSVYVLHHCPGQGCGQTQRTQTAEAKVPHSVLSAESVQAPGWDHVVLRMVALCSASPGCDSGSRSDSQPGRRPSGYRACTCHSGTS